MLINEETARKASVMRGELESIAHKAGGVVVQFDGIAGVATIFCRYEDDKVRRYAYVAWEGYPGFFRWELNSVDCRDTEIAQLIKERDDWKVRSEQQADISKAALKMVYGLAALARTKGIPQGEIDRAMLDLRETDPDF